MQSAGALSIDEQVDAPCQHDVKEELEEVDDYNEWESHDQAGQPESDADHAGVDQGADCEDEAYAESDQAC